MELWGTTNCGKVRRQNQDIFKILFDKERDVAVLVVCDGMGGANAGNIASSIAADTFMHSIGKHIDFLDSRKEISMRMSEAVTEANRNVYVKSMTSDELYGMGTTLAAAFSSDTGQVIVNVGDSRVYHITTSSITQVTKDHSIVEEMVTRGDLTRAEARRHPKKNLITRALGATNYETPDVFYLNIKSGEFLLLCSDGLSNLVFESEILYELQSCTTVRLSCENLVKMALERGAPDNVTAVLFKK